MVRNMINIGTVKSLFPDDTKPFPEPMLTVNAKIGNAYIGSGNGLDYMDLAVCCPQKGS